MNSKPNTKMTGPKDAARPASTDKKLSSSAVNDVPGLADPLRRRLLAAGSLLVSFTLAPAGRALAQGAAAPPAAAPPPAPNLPASLKTTPLLDAWIRIDEQGLVTVYTGKAELGTGIKTALLQVAAEQLHVAPSAVTMITADTGATPNEGYTAGSHTMADSGTAIFNAAAQVRALLAEVAAARWGLPTSSVTVRNGIIGANDGRRMRYGEAISGANLHRNAQPVSPTGDPQTFSVIGQSLPRLDIPAKVSGGMAYVQDLRLPGMVHARVLRPPTYGARLVALDATRVEAMPGVLKVVRDGSYVAVVAGDEWQAIVALRALAAAATWSAGRTLPAPATIHATLQGLPARDIVVADTAAAGSAAFALLASASLAPLASASASPSTAASASSSIPASGSAPAEPGGRTLRARFTKPYLMHGSIGPSCAVAHLAGDTLTVWTHTQGVFPLRKGIAEMLAMPEDRVRCIHTPGAGCYGHNGADDVAADAALIARAVPGKPVRVQWMREDENTWEPFGPAMVTELGASLDATGKIAQWHCQIWSNSHNERIENAGRLMPTWTLARPFTPAPPKPIPMPEGGGDRNSIPLYTIPRSHIVQHFIAQMPLRVSAMRSLGAHMNVFAIESFMDELAALAHTDPVEFRLRHLDDRRAQAVIRLAAERFGWGGHAPREPGHGIGFAFAQYKNLMAYVAIALEVFVDHESGDVRIGQVVAAVDCGQIVSPDGVRNQIEGGILQSASWTLYEQVGYDQDRITSFDWSGYPIMRFAAVPASVDVQLIDRPGAAFLGAGEAAQGPMGAALANAIGDATGLRLRDMPLAGTRLKTALGA